MIIGEILSFISAPVTQWFKNRGDVITAKHKRTLAVITNQARLASDKESNNHEWEMASLENQDTSLRWCSFWLFALPILITVISPEYGAVIWKNLTLVPEWFVTVFISMIGGIWGIVELKKAIPQVVSAWRSK
tara:strand:+ start:5653 stop:6051 length:399 start_codon:yes stop_codon:yes gene_type:complete